jgi:hypothetical protein
MDPMLPVEDNLTSIRKIVAMTQQLEKKIFLEVAFTIKL